MTTDEILADRPWWRRGDKPLTYERIDGCPASGHPSAMLDADAYYPVSWQRMYAKLQADKRQAFETGWLAGKEADSECGYSNTIEEDWMQSGLGEKT